MKAEGVKPTRRVENPVCYNRIYKPCHHGGIYQITPHHTPLCKGSADYCSRSACIHQVVEEHWIFLCWRVYQEEFGDTYESIPRAPKTKCISRRPKYKTRGGCRTTLFVR